MRVTPQDHFVKICHDELEALMGPVDTSLRSTTEGSPTGIMMVGLQGSGKTTTAGKLANKLLKEGKQAAARRRRHLPPRRRRPAQGPRRAARRAGLPRAGRLAAGACAATRFEAAQRAEARRGHLRHRRPPRHRRGADGGARGRSRAHVAPENILLVADAMIGQDAVKTAAEFDRRLALDGFILTKLDGDARGGAALSIKEVTGKPIKFLGMGEALDKLEEFRPEGLACRILGFGDIVGLMKDFEQLVDEEKAEEDAQKLLSGDFTLEDFVEQIRIVRKMGPLKDLMEKFPLFGELPEQLPVRREGAHEDRGDGRLDDAGGAAAPRRHQRRAREAHREGLRPQREGGPRPPQAVQLDARGDEADRLRPGPPVAPPRREAAHAAPQAAGQGHGGRARRRRARRSSARCRAALVRTPAMAQQMGLPKGYTPPMAAGAMARARLMGYAPEPISLETKKDRDARNKKRKAERQARKKGRKRGRK